MENVNLFLLKDARLHFNLSLENLARILNITEKELYLIEQGRKHFPQSRMKDIALLINSYISEKDMEYPYELLYQFFNYYEPIIPLSCVNESKPIGDKNNRSCRYCGKTRATTTFRKLAHTFPASIGNRTLFSYDECDECNELFCIYEDAFGKYTNLERILSWTHTRSGWPKLKMKNNLGMAFSSNGVLNVHMRADSNSVEIDEAKQTITFIHKYTYIPQYVYKILFKMALAIMPESELKNFSYAKLWLINKFNITIPSENMLTVIKTFVPGPRPFGENIYYTLFKRKNLLLNIPYMIFFIAFSNYAYQVPLFFCNNDGIGANSIMFLPRLPMPKKFYNTNYGKITHRLENFTSNVKQESMPFVTMHYDKIIKQQPPIAFPNKILYK